MKNMKLGKKFIVTFGIILALFAISSVFSIINLRSVLGNLTEFYEAPYQNTAQIAEMRRAIQSAAKNIGYATMVSDTVQTQKYIDDAQAELALLQTGVDFLEKNFPGDQKLVSDFMAAMNNGKDIKEQIFAAALASDNETATSIFFNDYQPVLLAGNAQLLKINEFSQSNATRLFEKADKSAQIAIAVVITLVVITILLTVMLAVYLTKSLTRPIKEIEAASHKMASGDLKAVIHYTSKDELGNLAESTRTLVSNMQSMIGDIEKTLSSVSAGNFDVQTSVEYAGDFQPIRKAIDTITVSLSDTLGQINQASDQVSSGSEQVSSGAQALSQGATEQASSIEELAAAINEISHQIKETAENSDQASAKANDVGNEAAESNARMQDLLGAMNDISSSSNEIGKIIKTIEDIAFQTNILALNAAVEAARAGTAGKGFAVVADEVRNLASKSAEASKSTASLIETSLKAVENGTKIADATAQSLGMVVSGVKDVAGTIDKISEASKEQANSISQVTTGVDQISAVVQTNSATAEESAAASEELSGQANMLKSLVSKFHLKGSAFGGSSYDSASSYASGASEMPHYNASSKY